MVRMTKAARRIARAEDGAVTPLVAMSLIGMISVGVLAFDYSRLLALDTELQNAADQAALAAATQLHDETCAAPETAARQLVANETRFATDDDSSIISIPDGGVVCEDGRVTVTVEARTLGFALTPIHMMTTDERSGTTLARASAELRSAICKVPPLMICNPVPGEGPFNIEQQIGKGLELVGGGGGAWAPGNFGFLDVGAGNVGNPDLFDAIGKVATSLTCVSADEDEGVDMNPGVGAAFVGALNTRFDIYDGWGRNNCGVNSAGAGMSHCPPALNVTKDVVRTRTAGDAASCRIQPSAWRLLPENRQYLPAPGAGYTTAVRPDADGVVDAMGHPRDICHAVSADGDCPAGPFGDGIWDRARYFQVNHPGNTSWQTELGPTPTRYEVYQWEIEHALSGTLAHQDVAPNLRSYQAPICAAGLGAGPATADRRLASVAVINCQANGVNGAATSVPVEEWVDVFLVEPAINRPRTQAAEIYVEFVGKTIMAGNGSQPQLVKKEIPVLVR